LVLYSEVDYEFVLTFYDDELEKFYSTALYDELSTADSKDEFISEFDDKGL
jgi:hypothetical protein